MEDIVKKQQKDLKKKSMSRENESNNNVSINSTQKRPNNVNNKGIKISEKNIQHNNNSNLAKNNNRNNVQNVNKNRMNNKTQSAVQNNNTKKTQEINKNNFVNQNQLKTKNNLENKSQLKMVNNQANNQKQINKNYLENKKQEVIKSNIDRKKHEATKGTSTQITREASKNSKTMVRENTNNNHIKNNKIQSNNTANKNQIIREREKENNINNKNQEKIKQQDTSGDTKIFQVIKKEDIENEKRNQLIKKENIEKNLTHKKKSKKPILIFLLIILILILLLLIASTVFGIINMNTNKIIKGVYINNIEVSNLTKQEAIEKINNELNNEENNYIIVKHNEYSKQIRLSNLEGKFNVEECVDAAYNLGRSRNIMKDNSKTIETMLSNINLITTFSYNEELLEKVINEIALELPGVATDSSYIVDNDKIIIKNSKDGIQIKTSEFKKNIIEFFEKGEKSLEIPVEQVARKEIDIEKIHEEIYKAPKDAYYTTNPLKIYKEEDGLDFAISIEQAKQMLSEDKDEYEIPLKSIKPKITVANLDSGAYPDQLSTFTTNYGTSDVNRNTNIALAAKSINSVVLMPGETFSYNDLIGECSTRTGYKAATIYMNGELSTGIGGGICQVSTTLYNAVLRANLEIVERKNHSLGVTYVPSGQDAMVSIGSQDFKFKNNRDYPIKVVAFVGTGSITCQIHGLKQETEYEVKLASTTIENTATRYKVQTYKILYLNGVEVSRTLLSTDTYKRH